ncbi:BQ5605_C055g12657 [Microbotryum silenes-dioicae]|uniref:BQ5605_C055g12657 protein n=1 Tax=Microbotryum silenes-dioicae TaxID=796604 RepID=A0A2X0NA40_9BASI|nr:BQ5605_C055g12657 [Microbotryum silenes-dioicae]
MPTSTNQACTHQLGSGQIYNKLIYVYKSSSLPQLQRHTEARNGFPISGIASAGGRRLRVRLLPPLSQTPQGARASFFARGSQESVPCGIWQLPIYTVDFSSARAIDRAPRFGGFWLVPPFNVEKVDFSSARAIDRAPRFDGFWLVPPFRVEKVDFSSARAIDLEKVDFSSARAIDRAPRFDGFWLVPPFNVEKVDFSSARAIHRAPRFDGFWLVPPFRVEKVDFSSARAIDRAPRFDGFAEKVDFNSARAIDRAPRFDGFWLVPPFRVEKVDFSSARAIDRALSIFIFTGNLGFYSKTYPGIGLRKTSAFLPRHSTTVSDIVNPLLYTPSTETFGIVPVQSPTAQMRFLIEPYHVERGTLRLEPVKWSPRNLLQNNTSAIQHMQSRLLTDRKLRHDWLAERQGTRFAVLERYTVISQITELWNKYANGVDIFYKMPEHINTWASRWSSCHNFVAS